MKIRIQTGKKKNNTNKITRKKNTTNTKKNYKNIN